MVEEGAFTIYATGSDVDKRLDIVISLHVEDCSRSLAGALIKKGTITVKGVPRKPGYKVKPGDIITGFIPSPSSVKFSAEPVPFRILFEDDYLMVVDKPPGLVVHPAPGHHGATLVNGVLFHCPDLKGVGKEIRPGIVHRLDKNTSGIILIAKCNEAHEKLSDQFKYRKIKKEYLALVWGQMASMSGSIHFDIGRHPKDRKKMSVHSHRGRQAETQWIVKESFDQACLLQLDLKTGRTHQIRVHCAAINHPILGDEIYGKSRKATIKKKDGREKKIPRQMLHAWHIRFEHPADKKTMEFEAKMPADMKEIIDFLKAS
ncbi:MAG: RluA family pseudouridine synthase [Desulfobacterales bacterium]